MEAISEIEVIVKEAEESLSVIIDKRTHSIRPHVADAVRRGAVIRSISPESYVHSVDVKREINIEDEQTIIDAELSGQAIVADQDEFPLYLWLTEKAVFISFPTCDEAFDYTGFYSSHPDVVSLGMISSSITGEKQKSFLRLRLDSATGSILRVTAHRRGGLTLPLNDCTLFS